MWPRPKEGIPRPKSVVARPKEGIPRPKSVVARPKEGIPRSRQAALRSRSETRAQGKSHRAQEVTSALKASRIVLKK